MVSQVQGIAGKGRKVNKKLRVPMTLGPISQLFSVLWAHYPGTVFEEGEDINDLTLRMKRWYHEIVAVNEIPLSVFKAVVYDLDGLQEYERDVKCPDLNRIIELCELKQAKMSEPRDKALGRRSLDGVRGLLSQGA